MYSGSQLGQEKGKTNRQLYGSVPFKVPYGTSVVTSLKASSSGMFPAVPDAYGTYSGEIAFRFTDFKNSAKGYYFITSLNGAGQEEVRNFPEDEDLQVAALESRIEVIGSAMHSETERTLNGIEDAVNRNGIKHGFASTELLFGSYVKASVPNPTKIRDRSILFPKGTPNGKVTMIFTPITSETNCDRFISITQKFAFDTELMRKLKNVPARLQNREIAAFVAINKQKIIDAILFIDQLEKAQVIAPITFHANCLLHANPAAGAGTEAHYREMTEIKLSLAKAFDVIGSTKAVDGFNMNAGIRATIENTKERITKALNWDGRVSNVAIGFNPALNANPGLERNQPREDALGEMIELQYNHRKSAFMALEEFWKSSWDKVMGRVIAPSPPGGDFLYI